MIFSKALNITKKTITMRMSLKLRCRKSITRETEDYFNTRPEVKFRFSAAFIKYATAHPQPKPILRLHSAHSRGELKVVGSNLKAAYLRNKCPHGLGALSLTSETLVKVVPSNEYKNKKNAVAAAAAAFNKNKKINIAVAMRAVIYHQAYNTKKKIILAEMPVPPTPPPNNGIYIGGVEILAHDREGYGVKVRHNPQDDYPTYNPQQDDSHNMLLPENLIKDIMRMRPNLLGNVMRKKTIKYQKWLDYLCDDEGTAGFRSFKCWLRMNKRRRKINKKRRTAIQKFTKQLCAGNVDEHINDCEGINACLNVNSLIDRYDDCPAKIKPNDYFNKFLNAQDRFEHTRIALYYEERRQLIARGLIDPFKIINRFDELNYPPPAHPSYASNCLQLLGDFEFEGMKKSNMVSEFIARTERLGNTHRLDAIARAYRYRDDGLKVVFLNYQPFQQRLSRAKNRPKITRKMVQACPTTVKHIKSMMRDTAIGKICGYAAQQPKFTKWKQCVAFIMTRFNLYENKGQSRSSAIQPVWREYDTRECRTNAYHFRPDLVVCGKNARGITTSNNNTIYQEYYEDDLSHLLPAARVIKYNERFKEIIECEIECFKLWVVFNLNQPNGRAFQDIVSTIKCERGLPAVYGPYTMPRKDYANACDDEEVVYDGVIIAETVRHKPHYNGGGSLMSANYDYGVSKCSHNLRLPYLEHDDVDGVRYVERDYAKTELIHTHKFDENPRRRRDSVCLVKQKYTKHKYALIGGGTQRGWDITPLTNGDISGLMTKDLCAASTRTSDKKYGLASYGYHDIATHHFIGEQ